MKYYTFLGLFDVPVPQPFNFTHLKIGDQDDRGAKIAEILWTGENFAVYKTEDDSIRPAYANDQTQRQSQRAWFLAIARASSDFHFLIEMLERNERGAHRSPFYKRQYARLLAQTLSGHPQEATDELRRLVLRLERQLQNQSRIVHFFAVCTLAAIVAGSAGALLFVLEVIGSIDIEDGRISIGDFLSAVFSSEAPEIPGAEHSQDQVFSVRYILLAIMMGSIGTLFSTAAGLRTLAVDATVTNAMQRSYAMQRVLIGGLGALVLYFAIESGVFSGLFGFGGTESRPEPAWMVFFFILAGFSERMVPNLLSGKVEGLSANSLDEDDIPPDAADPDSTPDPAPEAK